MQKLDIDKFWADDEFAKKDNCFYEGSLQIALSIRMSDECVYAELGENNDPWSIERKRCRIELNKRYNEKAMKPAGKRLLKELYSEGDEIFPQVKKIGEVFKGRYEYIKNIVLLIVMVIVLVLPAGLVTICKNSQ